MTVNPVAAGRLVAFALLTAGLPTAAAAQVWIGGSRPRSGSVEVGAGGNWTGGQDFANAPASLTVNPSVGQSSFDLFASDPSIGATAGLHGSVAVYLSRALAIEAGVRISRPQMTVRLSDDAEDAPDQTATARMTSYVFSGSLVYHFGQSARTVPFVAAGAGHVRDVHSGNELVETGVEYHGKAGLKMWFNARRKLGFRAEGGVLLRSGGFDYDDERRIVPTAAASLVYLY